MKTRMLTCDKASQLISACAVLTRQAPRIKALLLFFIHISTPSLDSQDPTALTKPRVTHNPGAGRIHEPPISLFLCVSLVNDKQVES